MQVDFPRLPTASGFKKRAFASWARQTVDCLDAAGGDAVALAGNGHAFVASRGPDGQTVRADLERPLRGGGHARGSLSLHRFDRETWTLVQGHYPGKTFQNGPDSQTVSGQEPTRPASEAHRLLRDLGTLKQQEAMALMHRVWNAWQDGGARGKLELFDGSNWVRASGTPDGKSFQTEVVRFDSSGKETRRCLMAIDLSEQSNLFQMKLSPGLPFGRSSLHHPLPPTDRPDLRERLIVNRLLTGGGEDRAMADLEGLASGLGPGESLDEAVHTFVEVCGTLFSTLHEVADENSVYQVVRGLDRLGLEPGTSSEVLRCYLGRPASDKTAAGFATFAQLLREEQDPVAACRSYARDPVVWEEARQLAEQIRPGDQGVHETARQVVIGGVRLRKKP